VRIIGKAQDGLISQKYLDFHHTHDEEEKTNITSMHVDKLSCDFFLWWNSKSQGIARDWDTFKNKFFKHFHNIEEDEVFVKLT
jgi:hypothetical protein